MGDILLTSCVISVIYFFVAFLRQKYVVKEEKPVKQFSIETVIVGLSSIIGLFAIENYNKGLLNKATPNAFIGKPEF